MGMRLMSLRMMAVVMLLAGVSYGQAQPASIGAAQQAFAEGDFRKSLQEISRVLASPQAKPGSKERYDALMLRGECMLQLKEPDLASSAFMSAANVMRADPNLADTATARAMSILVKSSPNLKYVPAGGEPIDISDPASRKKALAALLTDRLAAIKAQLAEALKSTSLEPIYKLVPAMVDVFALEIASTGKPTETEPMLKSLGEHGRNLITAELTRLNGEISQLETLANEPTSTGALGRGYSRRGLDSNEQKVLQNDVAYLDKIRQVCQDGRRGAKRFGGTGEAWEPLLAEATDLRDRAEAAYVRK